MQVEKRFDMLNALGRILFALGWAVSGLAVLGAFAVIVTGSSEGVARMVALLGALGGFLVGIIIVALSQMAQCLVAIERTTRATSNSTQFGLAPKTLGSTRS